MFKKFLTAIVVCVAVLSIAGCKKEVAKPTYKEAVGYGIVHKDYVGFAEMTVIDNKVGRVVFDEAYLPYTWAQVTLTGETVPADVVENGAKKYGKYLKIGGKLFTGVLRETDLVIGEVTYANEKVKYSAEGIDDLYTWLRAAEANCKWYVEALKAGDAYVAAQDGKKSSYAFNSMKGFFKSSTDYWETGNYAGLTWARNLRQFAIAIQGTDLATGITLTQRTEDGKSYWNIGSVESKCTIVDLKDYYIVAQNAFKAAKK